MRLILVSTPDTVSNWHYLRSVKFGFYFAWPTHAMSSDAAGPRLASMSPVSSVRRFGIAELTR